MDSLENEVNHMINEICLIRQNVNLKAQKAHKYVYRVKKWRHFERTINLSRRKKGKLVHHSFYCG